MLVNTESRTVKVTNKEDAIRMIKATCYSYQLNHNEMKEFDNLQKVAVHFGINTDDIKIIDNPKEEDRFQGFHYIYEYN